ncbi:retrovirus-related pol polyprotein from transposon TNT 1-94 [Tanacetum coccineum]
MNENSVDTCNKCLELEAELVKKNDVYIELSKQFSNLEQHCISLELQAKDTVISKLKETIHSLGENANPAKVKKDIDEIEIIDIELKHNVAKLLSKNKKLHKEREHLKKTYKELYDSIKPSRVHAKEQCDSLIANLNSKSMENADLKTQIQEKVFANAALKNELKKLKGKNVIDTAVSKPYATTIAPGVDSHKPKDSNQPLLHSTGVNGSTGASGSKPIGNTKNNRISQSSSNNKTNKVKDQSRSVKSRKNKKNHVAKIECNAYVMQSVLNANSKSVCAICNECLFDANHDKCVLDYVQDVNVLSKSKPAKCKNNKQIWKPMGKVYTKIGYKWKPIGRTFTIVGNKCPLTRFASTKVVPLKEITTKPVVTPTPGIMVYSRRPKAPKSVDSSSKSKIIESRISNQSEPTQTGESIIRNVTISRVYYIEGLRHNLFSVGQFCNSDLEVAFRKYTCFVRNLEGVDLLTGSQGTNLYTLSIGDIMKPSLIFLLSKASKTKFWLWHRRLFHLNFGTINQLAKQGLVRGLPKLKFEKDHLCSACSLEKSKKQSHKPKFKDTNQEKLYLLHVKSINGKKYILVIVDDYSRFTWVKFLRSKDEVLEFIIKFLKMLQVRLNETVKNIRTYNGTEFVNQTLCSYYEDVGISHETSVACTPQQNGIVKR